MLSSFQVEHRYLELLRLAIHPPGSPLATEEVQEQALRREPRAGRFDRCAEITAMNRGVAYIGLTGGIGSGKSTVAAKLAELGAVVIDADSLSREVVAPGTPGLSAVASEFGQTVLREDGSLHRGRLAELVFADDATRERLNAIVHPLVRERTRELIATVDDGAVVVHDVPLLLENQMAAQYHLVVAVLADEDRRIQRLQQRGLSAARARSRMAHQAGDVQRRDAADVLIDNDGSLEQTLVEVKDLWRSRLAPLRDNLIAGKPAETPTQLQSYDPEWPLRYRRMNLRLAAALGEQLISLQHVGATAVPGMSASGAIDIRAWLRGGEGGGGGAVDGADLAPALAQHGWFPLGTAWRVPRFGFADPGNPARLYAHRRSI